MPRALILAAILLSAPAWLGGCSVGTGILYTNVIEPLDVNMDKTPMGIRSGEAQLTKVTEPITGAQVGVEINSNAIADAARRSGLTKVYYADLHRREFFLGIWQQRTILVYGE